MNERTEALRVADAMRRYGGSFAQVAACAEIAGFDGRHSYDVAEAICPSLARLRRHARACAVLARRLGR